jgi:hypothetical protein
MNEPLHSPPVGTSNPGDVNQQYVSGAKLLEMLFPEDCRPTVRWLRDQQVARRIPFVKIGRMVFFSPQQVRRSLENKQN